MTQPSTTGIANPSPRPVDAPRTYQLEIGRKALEGNVIAVADTGSGKTLISVLLLKNIVAKARATADETGHQQRISFFVVNKVPLVFQQQAYIVNNSDIRAEPICGAMDVDNFDNDRWQSIFQQFEVIVLTGQILFNIFQHSFYKIQDCDLIIFDECHHATGQHCYKQIMEDFYFKADEKRRPKIFGMTASPPKDKGVIGFSAMNLEKTMDGKIFTASYDEVVQYTQRPKERVIWFNGNPPLDINPPPLSMSSSAPGSPFGGSLNSFNNVSTNGYGSNNHGMNGRCPPALKDLCAKHKIFKPAVNCYLFAENELGPWCAAKVWEYAFQGLEEDILHWSNVAAKGGPGIPGGAGGPGIGANRKLHDLQEAKKLTQGIKQPLLDPELSSVTEKMQTLVKILKESRREGFCGILFVERRPIAHVINDFLKECKKFGPDFDLDFINSAVITGHGAKGDVTKLRMQLKEQRRVLSGFRRGVYNLLVATDVAEEGLDIDRCRLVIRFDIKTTLISFIQSRGRARDPISDYVIMQRIGDKDFLSNISSKELDMRVWCGELPEDRVCHLHPNMLESDSSELYENELRELVNIETEYIVPSTGARLSFSASIERLHHYCSSLPGDEYTRFAPVFEINSVLVPGQFKEHYECRLTLPPNVPVTHFLSDKFRSKRLAKRSAAYKACKRLYELGALDDRMLPHKKVPVEEDDEIDDDAIDDVESGDASGGGVAEETNVEKYPIHQPKFWSSKIVVPLQPAVAVESEIMGDVPTVQLFGTIMTIRSEDGPLSDHRQLCLLTNDPLPEFDPIELFFDGQSRYVDLQAVDMPMRVEAQLIHKLHNYERCLFQTLFRKPFDIGSPETGMRHIIAPLLRGNHGAGPLTNLKYVIDWDEIKSAPVASTTATITTTNTAMPAPLDQLSWDKVQDLVLHERGEYHRLYYPIAVRRDLNPSSLIPDSISGTREAGRGKTTTFWQFYKYERETDIQDLSQPLIEVIRPKPLEDFLQPGLKQSRTTRSSTARFLIPELCCVSPVRASILRSSAWVISVLDRLDGLLKSQECLKELHLEEIHQDLILEALTSSESSYKMNYQRLELLGDTFLKLIMSVDVFIRYPLMDEGQLTRKRTTRVSNKWLYKRASLMRLDRFVVRKPPVNRHFFPLSLTSAAITTTAASTSPISPAVSPNHELTVTLDQHLAVRNSNKSDENQNSTSTQPEEDRWKISKKNLADLVESISGAAFLSAGFELGLQTIQTLVCPLEGISSWSDFSVAYLKSKRERDILIHGASSSWTAPSTFIPDPMLGNLFVVEDKIGYKFKDLRLLAEALTHASWVRPQTPCYQRLEFLGDSVLDMLVALHWVKRYPVFGPGLIHEIKAACVNNQILGVLCIKLGLHQHILHMSSSLATDIHRAVEMIKDVEEEAAFERREPEREYWSEFVITKALGDVLESVLAAVLVDSGWDYVAVQGVFDRTILPVLDKHISMETLKRHPVSDMFRVLQASGCQQGALLNLTSPSPVNGSSNSGEVDGDENGDTSQPSWKSWNRAKEFDEDQVREPAVQECALVLHGQPILKASNIQSKVARREVAKQTMFMLKNDPEWLDRNLSLPQELNIVLSQSPDKEICTSANDAAAAAVAAREAQTMCWC
ncbi:Dicer-like protein 1 [Gryganskiella cystojenkinii]|nr:Dicer-like protein 1 [Gryganskiella cystojenkinii]